MTKTLTIFLACILVPALALSGCAGLGIPPPDMPVTPLPEPPIEVSTITVPVTLSLDAILRDLGLEQSRERVGGAVRRFLKRQALRNETRLVQNKFVRRQLDQVWSSVQKPIPLQNGLSLFLNPEALSVSTLPDQEEDITLVLGVRARPKITAGSVGGEPKPLPEISIVPAPPATGFHIALESELSFEQLGSELTARLKGSSYAGKDGSVTVEQVKVYGSGESLVAAVTVRGSTNGTVYLYGTPFYDRSARTLVLHNADYTLETRQVLAASADWLLHSGLREKLAQRAVWPLGEKIDAARDSITRALNRQVYDRVKITGRVSDMRPVAVGLSQKGIKAVLEADGNVEVHVLD
jgi:hypothetical protein